MVEAAEHIVIVGAGAAGLMAARELARAGRKVTVLEARDRCGGRIDPLSAEAFGYPAAGGAEFIHGEAQVTRGLLREAGLSFHAVAGEQWRFDGARLVNDDRDDPYEAELHAALRDLTADLPIAEFLRRHFAGDRYAAMRQSIARMVEGYDAADPERASTLALREEWMDGGHAPQARVDAGYGALIDFLAMECRKQGVAIRLGCMVTAIEQDDRMAQVRCSGGEAQGCDRVILTVPLPLLKAMALPAPTRARLGVVDDIGFGNVIKILLRFARPWWREREQDLARMTFVVSDETIPVWWTQYPSEHPVLTGWLGGPRTAELAGLDQPGLIDTGLDSLGAIFGLSREDVASQLVAAAAIDWSKDPFARGAYSWATPRTRAAQDVLGCTDGLVLLSGEALYRGRDMGTVEAALASGLDTAKAILRA